ncbi:hypothetical protein [Longispora albida]|uniref:hypothetical protein n=1 Tax=Longispora albida TaxID=203523 RepID=UPI00036BE808|nr:hypothetical protein [Longispora albida]
MLHLTTEQHQELGAQIAEFTAIYPPSNLNAVIYAHSGGHFAHGESLPAGSLLIATRGEVETLMIGYGFLPIEFEESPDRLAEFTDLVCGPAGP